MHIVDALGRVDRPPAFPSQYVRPRSWRARASGCHLVFDTDRQRASMDEGVGVPVSSNDNERSVSFSPSPSVCHASVENMRSAALSRGKAWRIQDTGAEGISLP